MFDSDEFITEAISETAIPLEKFSGLRGNISSAPEIGVNKIHINKLQAIHTKNKIAWRVFVPLRVLARCRVS